MSDATHQGVGGQSAAQIMAQIRADAYARGRKDAFEEAAKVADDLGGGRVERNPDGSLRTYDMNCKHDRGSATLNAMRVRAHTIAQAIRALSDAQLLDRPGDGE